jgi:predicted GNAT family N-acyltransferase
MELFVQNWHKIQAQATAIRHEVFILEQKVPEELELDGLDDQAWHVLILEKKIPVATGRLLLEFDEQNLMNSVKPIGRIGRMAVLKAYRGQGLGRQILTELIDKGLELGLNEFYLHAQLTAQSLYAKLGFIGEGEVFEEAGIDHRTMRLHSQSKT